MSLEISFADMDFDQHLVIKRGQDVGGDPFLGRAAYLLCDTMCPHCGDGDIDLVSYTWCNQFRIGCLKCGSEVVESGFYPLSRDRALTLESLLGKDGREVIVVNDREQSLSRIRSKSRSREYEEKRRSQFQAETLSKKERYAAYLKTPGWRKKRDIILRRDSFLCQSCLTARATEVHHLSYDYLDYDSPGSEPGFDLASICRDCHERIHAK